MRGACYVVRVKGIASAATLRLRMAGEVSRRAANSSAFIAKDVVPLLLGQLRCGTDRVAAGDGRPAGHEAPVVIPVADQLVVEQHFHGGKLARQPLKRKRNAAHAGPVFERSSAKHNEHPDDEGGHLGPARWPRGRKQFHDGRHGKEAEEKLQTPSLKADAIPAGFSSLILRVLHSP